MPDTPTLSVSPLLIFVSPQALATYVCFRTLAYMLGFLLQGSVVVRNLESTRNMREEVRVRSCE